MERPEAVHQTKFSKLSRGAHRKNYRRAPRACLSCRARKVRCDVSQRGQPCLNCHLDDETCVVTGRASRHRDVHPKTGQTMQVSHSPNATMSRPERQYADAFIKPKRDGPPIVVAPNFPEPDVGEDVVNLSTDSPIDILSSLLDPSYGPSTTFLSASNELFNIPYREGNQKEKAFDVIYSYYAFVTIGNLPKVPLEHVNLLDSQGCFRIHARPILDEFLEQYFLHVHPMLPLVHEGDFWDMYFDISSPSSQSSDGENQRAPLLLLQAMMFASCSFVSQATIAALGYQDIRSARASFYRRTKLLYDLESEMCPLSIAQATLLLSFWIPSSIKHTSTPWLCLAIQYAIAAEAHSYAGIHHHQQNLLKRVWWCCIIRDRTVSLSNRRPIQITRTHFDFRSPGLGVSDLVSELHRSKVYGESTKRQLAEILAQTVQLFVALTDTLTLVLPLNDDSGQMPESKDTLGIHECKVSLRRWCKDTELRFPMTRSKPMPSPNSGTGAGYFHESIVLYKNLMYMHYDTTRALLCHHEVLRLSSLQTIAFENDILWRGLIHQCRRELEDAATGIMECLEELITLNIAQWLPSSAVAFTALPLVLSVLDIKLSFPERDLIVDSWRLKQRRFNILVETMKTYQLKYDAVGWISEIVRHIINLAQFDHHPPPHGSTSRITNWTDILDSQPGSYLRLALIIDLSLSKNRLPEDEDFPPSLQGLFAEDCSPLKTVVGPGRGSAMAFRSVHRTARDNIESLGIPQLRHGNGEPQGPLQTSMEPCTVQTIVDIENMSDGDTTKMPIETLEENAIDK